MIIFVVGVSVYVGGVRVFMKYLEVAIGRKCVGGVGALVCLTAYTTFTASFSLLGVFVYQYLFHRVPVPNITSMLALFSILYISSLIVAGVFIDLFGGEKFVMVSFSLLTSFLLAVSALYAPEGVASSTITALLACTTAWLPIALGSYIRSHIDVACRGTIYGLGTGIGSLIAFGLYNLIDILSLRVIIALVGIIIAIAGIVVLLVVEGRFWFEKRVFKPSQLFYRRIPSLSLGIFVFYTMAGFVSVKLYPILGEFSLSIMAYTVTVPYLVFVITAGLLIDFAGRRLIGIAGFIILSIGNTLLAIYEGHYSILLSTIIPLIIIRIAYSFIDVYTVVTLIDLAGRRSKGLTLSIGLTAMASGILLGSLLAGLLEASRLGVIMGTLILIASIYIVIKIPETLPKRAVKKDEILKYIDKAKKIAEKEL